MWRVEPLIALALIALLATGPSASLAAQADSAGPAKQGVPKPLADAGEYGENLYDYARVNDWKNAEARLAALGTAVGTLRDETGVPRIAQNRLERDVDALKRSVALKERLTTMREANRVTLDVADMTAAYQVSVPVEVTRLDYYGRELEIWAEVGTTARLRATAAGMRHQWDLVRPRVEVRGPAEAAKFGALVARVERARTPKAYARLASPVLEEVDHLEAVFAGR
jgi:hypothetical protein